MLRCAMPLLNVSLEKESCFMNTQKSVSILLFLALLVLGTSCTRQTAYPAPPLSGGNVSIRVADLPLNVPQFFTYRSDGTRVNFFVIRQNSGVQAYADACVTCYHAKRGYAYDDGAVVCRYCSTRYPVSKLDKGIGGCYPIRIAGKTMEGSFLIPLGNIEALADKF